MGEAVKILCVDDEQNVLNALRRLFLDDDYTLLTASSGEEGLRTLETENVQIVISDYRMPVMNGVDFLREVRRQWPDTVRIVLSGYADATAIVSAINEGQIYKFVPKPWNDDELRVTVSNAVERYFLYKKNLELAGELTEKNQELTRLNTELKKLLEEKSLNLEFRSQVLSVHQNMLDSLPVAIMGVDFNSMVVMCNSRWIKVAGMEGCPLGQRIDNCAGSEVMAFIEDVKAGGRVSKKTQIDGAGGWLIGSVMDYQDGQKGIIIVFASVEDICE